MKRPNLTNVIYPASDPLSLCVRDTEWLHFHSSAQRGLENDCRITTACYASPWVTFSNPYFVNTPPLLIRFVIYIWFQSLLENFYCRVLRYGPVSTIFMNRLQLKFELSEMMPWLYTTSYWVIMSFALTFIHSAHAFIQSDLHCIWRLLNFTSSCNWIHDLGAASTTFYSLSCRNVIQ